mgnify:FL=1|jgi:hypothetical protein|tara:strand:+ start:1106 stop:1489 length:384 start_codon:yes stop_codon:yes gene_type:complete
MAKSNYLENKVIDHFLGTSSTSAPSNVYMGLFTSNPTDANSGTEVSGNGYSRQVITFNAASSGSATNSSAETFTASGGNWGTITHFGIFDASSSGNLLYHGALTDDKVIEDGDSLVVAASAITITET